MLDKEIEAAIHYTRTMIDRVIHGEESIVVLESAHSRLGKVLTEQGREKGEGVRTQIPIATLTQDPIEIGYTNWRGEYALRNICPIRVWFGATDWHPEPQWLLTAIDMDKNAERDFAIKDIGTQAPTPASGEQMKVVTNIVDSIPFDKKRRRMLLVEKYDPSRPEFWLNEEARQRHKVTPLVTLDAAQKALAERGAEIGQSLERRRQLLNRWKAAEAERDKLREALTAIQDRLHNAVGSGAIEPPNPQLIGVRSEHVKAALFSIMDITQRALNKEKL